MSIEEQLVVMKEFLSHHMILVIFSKILDMQSEDFQLHDLETELLEVGDDEGHY